MSTEVSAIINMVGGVMVGMAISIDMAHMLPMRRRGLCLVVLMVINAFMALLRYAVPATSYLALASIMLVLLVGYEGPVRYRVLAVMLEFTAIALSEIVSSGIWVVVTGTTMAGYDNQLDRPLLMTMLRVVDLAIYLVVSALLRTVLRRVMRGGATREVVLRFLALPLLQGLLLIVLLYMEMFTGAFGHADTLVLCVLAVLYMVTDLILLSSIEQGSRAAEERSKARAREAQFEAYLAQCAALDERLKYTARLRHDARNHMQVIGSLIDRGELDEARRYAVAFLADVQRGEGVGSMRHS